MSSLIKRIGLVLCVAALAACGGGGGGGSVAGPTGLAATALSDGDTLDVAWIRPAAQVTGYRLEHSTDGQTFTTLKTLTPGTTDTFVSLAAYPDNRTISFRVCGLLSSGTTGWSNTATHAIPLRAPAAVGAVVTYAADWATVLSVEVTWTNPSTASTGVRIERVPASGAAVTVATLSPGATRWVDTDPPESSTFHYEVVNLCGASTARGSSTSVTTLPKAARILSATGPAGAIALTWTCPGAVPDSVEVMMVEGLSGIYENSFWVKQTLPGTATSCTLTGLAYNYYSFRIRVTKGGTTSMSAPFPYVPPATVGGAALAAQPRTVPSGSSYILAPSGAVLVPCTWYAPPQVRAIDAAGAPLAYPSLSQEEILPSTSWSPSWQQGGFDAAGDPHVVAWRRNATDTTLWDLRHYALKAGAWTSEAVPPAAGTRMGSVTVLGDASGGLHLFWLGQDGQVRHLANGTGSWVSEDTGLILTAGTYASPRWAAVLDATGQPRVFATAGDLAPTLGQLALRKADGAWSVEAIPAATPLGYPAYAALLALPAGRLAAAFTASPSANGTRHLYWMERDADGTWQAPQSLGAQEWFLAAQTPDGARVALVRGGTVDLRDAAGNWTTETLCPDTVSVGSIAVAFSPQGKLRLLALAGNTGYGAPNPCILYAEP